jgi:hypothetical protein
VTTLLQIFVDAFHSNPQFAAKAAADPRFERSLADVEDFFVAWKHARMRYRENCWRTLSRLSAPAICRCQPSVLLLSARSGDYISAAISGVAGVAELGLAPFTGGASVAVGAAVAAA